MMGWIPLVLSTIACVQAFNNPILSDKKYYAPRATKIDGIYYVVAETPDVSSQVFPIHMSADLIQWKAMGYIFYENTTPTWAQRSTLNYPEVRQIGSNSVMYFSAENTTSSASHIGVAIAPHPLGPYLSIDRPIMSLAKEDSHHPAIINDEGRLYLLWTNSAHEILARQLNSNGLSFSTDQTYTLLQPSLDWEDNNLLSPWYVRRGDYHYIFYNGADFCHGVGVARSENAFGPYEKSPDPILLDNSNYECLHDVSIVKDVDDKGDVIFINAYRKGDVDHVFAVVLASLGWDRQDWPYVNDF